MDTVGKRMYTPNDLKIMIVSTPKTGNTWVKHLLSNIYELPIVKVGPKFDATEVDALGSRWITHQHYRAHPAIIDYGRRNDVIFVTTIRHPGDALVSKFHFVRNYIDRSTWADIDPSPNLVRDGDTIGEHTLSYVKRVKHGFADFLGISLGWIRSGESRIVRYEDLWRDPVTTLRDLTLSICEVSLECVERSVESCSLDLMRATSGVDPKFFRKGNVGGWKRALTPEIIDVLSRVEPYPAQFAALGYTLERDDPLTTLPKKPRRFKNPFHNVTHFDNGVPVPPVVIRLYLSLEPTFCQRWPSVEQTTAGSFYAWLNAPADQDPQRQEPAPVVTNLAHYVYRVRADVQSLFPDVFGQDRIKYIAWFIFNAHTSYNLDQAFTVSMQSVWVPWFTWCDLPAEEDPRQPGTVPILTNLAAYVYHIRPDLQVAFPDPFGKDRFRFARWFVNHAQVEYGSHKVLAEPVRGSAHIISQSLPEANNAILSLAFSLRRKLASLVGKVRA